MLLSLTLMLAASAAGPGASVDRPVVKAERSALDLLASDTRHVRAADGAVGRLLTEGARRSPTFARLVRRLQASDVIVYVESPFALPPDTTGRLLLQATTGTHRYLRVQVRATLPRDRAIAVIAHELHHALEIAKDPKVRDHDALVLLYRRIGHASTAAGYDTEAARFTGEAVRTELFMRVS